MLSEAAVTLGGLLLLGFPPRAAQAGHVGGSAGAGAVKWVAVGNSTPCVAPPPLPSGPVSGLGSRLTAEPLLSGKTGKAAFTPPARDLSSPASWVSSQGLCSALLGVD